MLNKTGEDTIERQCSLIENRSYAIPNEKSRLIKGFRLFKIFTGFAHLEKKNQFHFICNHKSQEKASDCVNYVNF
jgi:hypothetical protein